MELTILISIAIFIGVVALLAYLRMKSGNKFEIKNSEIAIALIPIVLFLLLTGKIQKFEFGDLKIEAAFVQASQAAIKSQISELEGLPVETLRSDSKEGVGRIPELVRRKTQALVFRMGHGGYYGPAIEQYLDELTKYPFFQYIVINNNDGTLFGMIDAMEVAATIKSYDGLFNSRDFANWLNRSDAGQLAGIPGFTSTEHSLHQDADKKAALELMESLNLEALPVVDGQQRLVGIVNRSRLTASLIIDVTKHLEGK